MNNETRYKVTKITVKDVNKTRMVQQGFEITGPVVAEVGQPMIVQGRGFKNLQTTPVVKITPGVGENFIVETESSVYSLEKK